MHNKLIISLGSNLDSEMNISLANRLLCQYFQLITFSESVYTEPLDLPGSNPFLNQVAIAYSPLYADDIRSIFKQIESQLGRNSGSKFSGKIPIDIDLLQWNDEILKPSDLKRDYISDALSALFELTDTRQ